MKKGRIIMLLVLVLSFGIVTGIFIGRNMTPDYVLLSPEERTAETITDAVIDHRLDINTATVQQLLHLPGIGQTLADRIVAYRTEHGSFRATDDLLNVEGIGEKTLQQIMPLIKVGE